MARPFVGVHPVQQRIKRATLGAQVVVVVALAIFAMAKTVNAQYAEVCLKPWAIPDKWAEHYPGDATWTADASFETVDDKGNPLSNPDVYIPNWDPAYTGFQLPRDLGLRLTLKIDDPQDQMRSGFFYAIDLGTAQGGNDYRSAIASCQDVLPPFFGSQLQSLGGDLKGPTVQGVADLINLDPTAEWDPVSNTVINSCAPSPACGTVSPRVVTVVAFDPLWYERSWLNGNQPILIAENFVSVFVDGIVGGRVTGYITTPRWLSTQ